MSDRKTYPDEFSRFVARITRIESEIRNLRVPTDGQFTQTVNKILALFDSLDQQVADSINKTSYDKTTIDNKLQQWNWGVLAPNRGGTGIQNAYSNLFTVGPWRAVWALSDGTMGTSQSIRSVKTDIMDADEWIPVKNLRNIKWVIYRMIDDKNLHLDDAQPMLGMIADDLDANGLGFLCEYDPDGTLVGINYPMLGVAALRLAQDAEERLDTLEQRITQLEQNQTQQ